MRYGPEFTIHGPTPSRPDPFKVRPSIFAMAVKLSRSGGKSSKMYSIPRTWKYNTQTLLRAILLRPLYTPSVMFGLTDSGPPGRVVGQVYRTYRTICSWHFADARLAVVT